MRRHQNPSHAGKSGFTLVEVTVAVTILTVGVMALAATFVSTSRLSEDNRDTRTLTIAFRNTVEALRAEDFSTLTQNFGPGTAKSQVWSGADGEVVFADPGNASISGQIIFFDEETTIPASFAGLTGGFDLNADGVVTAGALTDYRILPTRLTFTVNNAMSGSRSVTFDIILTPVRSW